MNKFGVSSLLFRELSFENALSRIKDTGFTIIDFSIILPTFCAHYNPLKTTINNDRNIKDLLDSNVLQVSTINAFPGYYNNNEPSIVTTFLKRCIEIAKILGAHSVTIPSGFKVNPDQWLENAKIVKKHLVEVSKFANDNGIFISIETPHIKTLTETLKESLDFHELLNSDIIKCTFDTSHVYYGEIIKIDQGFFELKDRVNHIHLRDAIDHDISITPGKGHIDFRMFFQEVQKQKYIGDFIYELEYHDYSDKKKFKELKFASEYIDLQFHNKPLPLKMRMIINPINLNLERFKDDPKEYIRKQEKLFFFLKKFKPIVTKFSPGFVYTGNWVKRFRFGNYNKVLNKKPGIIKLGNSSDHKIRIGIVGCGWAGRIMHGNGFQRLNNTVIIGGYDINVETATRFARQYNCKSFSSIEDLVKIGKPDLVSVCSRETAHYLAVKYLLENDIDVFCEKLMTTRYDHAKEIVNLAKEKSRVLAVNYNYRFIPGIQKIKEIVDYQALGKLCFFTINVSALSYAHALDLLSYLGGSISTICASYSNDNNIRQFKNTDWSLYDEDILYIPSIRTNVQVEFTKGGSGMINSSFYYDPRAFILSLEAVFENGAVTLNGINQFNILGKLSYISKHKIKVIDMNYKNKVYSKGYEYTFFNSIESFMKHYISDKKFETPGEQGLFNIYLEKMIFESNSKCLRIQM